jgi:hypothetical protein
MNWREEIAAWGLMLFIIAATLLACNQPRQSVVRKSAAAPTNTVANLSDLDIPGQYAADHEEKP